MKLTFIKMHFFKGNRLIENVREAVKLTNILEVFFANYIELMVFSNCKGIMKMRLRKVCQNLKNLCLKNPFLNRVFLNHIWNFKI